MFSLTLLLHRCSGNLLRPRGSFHIKPAEGVSRSLCRITALPFPPEVLGSRCASGKAAGLCFSPNLGRSSIDGCQEPSLPALLIRKPFRRTVRISAVPPNRTGGRFGGPPVVPCISVGWLGDDGHASAKGPWHGQPIAKMYGVSERSLWRNFRWVAELEDVRSALSGSRACCALRDGQFPRLPAEAAILGHKRCRATPVPSPYVTPVPIKALQGATILRRRRPVSIARGSHRAPRSCRPRCACGVRQSSGRTACAQANRPRPVASNARPRHNP